MSKLKDYSVNEISLIKGNDEYADHVYNDALKLVEKLSEQGHSGMSKNMVLNALSRLADFKPLSPLTGEESEWGTDASPDQNNRAYQVFRRDDGTAFDIEARVFSDDGGESWYTNGNSFKDITFPYDVPDEPERVVLS